MPTTYVYDGTEPLTPEFISSKLVEDDDLFHISKADMSHLVHIMNVQNHGVRLINCRPGDEKIYLWRGSGPKFSHKTEHWGVCAGDKEAVQYCVDERGVKQGLWRRWVNGVVRETRMYRDDLRHGPTVKINHKGQVEQRTTWHKGYMSGSEIFALSE